MRSGNGDVPHRSRGRVVGDGVPRPPVVVRLPDASVVHAHIKDVGAARPLLPGTGEGWPSAAAGNRARGGVPGVRDRCERRPRVVVLVGRRSLCGGRTPWPPAIGWANPQRRYALEARRGPNRSTRRRRLARREITESRPPCPAGDLWPRMSPWRPPTLPLMGFFPHGDAQGRRGPSRPLHEKAPRGAWGLGTPTSSRVVGSRQQERNRDGVGGIVAALEPIALPVAERGAGR